MFSFIIKGFFIFGLLSGAFISLSSLVLAYNEYGTLLGWYHFPMIFLGIAMSTCATWGLTPDQE